MPTPSTCHVTGYIETLLGVCPQNIVMKASPIQPYFNGAWTIPIDGVSFYPTVNGPTGSLPPASGYFDMALGETETSGVLIAFKAGYTGDGIYREILFNPVIIPNVPAIDMSSLLIPRTQS